MGANVADTGKFGVKGLDHVLGPVLAAGEDPQMPPIGKDLLNTPGLKTDYGDASALKRLDKLGIPEEIMGRTSTRSGWAAIYFSTPSW